MRKIVLLVLLISSILALNTLSCKKVETLPEGNISIVKLDNVSSIPADYGSLVSVTINPTFPRISQLWFQDNEGTIRMVSVGTIDKAILDKVMVIPRS
jgi:hypothetical protein